MSSGDFSGSGNNQRRRCIRRLIRCLEEANTVREVRRCIRQFERCLERDEDFTGS